MNMKKKRNLSVHRRRRERYLKPRITCSELMPQEALMAICKGGTMSGPMGPCGSCRGGGS